jgi:RNA recognition motif-containing protein
MKIRVNNIPAGTTDDDLAALFTPFGAVQYAFIPVDPIICKPKRYGFVAMMWDRDAQKAVAELDGADFNGNKLRVFVKEVKYNPQPQQRPDRTMRKRIPYRRKD